MFLIDGPILVAEAFRSSVRIDCVFVEPSALDSDVVWRARDAGVTIREVTDGALAKVLDLNSPQMMVAVAHQATTSMDLILSDARSRSRPVLVLVELADPGNVGTLIRAAEASGCSGVVLTEETVDLFNPKTVRATAGSIFRVPICSSVSIGSVLDRCVDTGMSSSASVVSDGTVIDEADLGGAVALFLGSEAHGLSPEVIERCDSSVSIPMEGVTESLNAGVAGSVILFEAARQRRASGRSPQ